MKKGCLILLICLLFGTAAGSTDLTKAGVLGQYLPDMAEKITSQLNLTQERNEARTMALGGLAVACVDVDLELPDTVIATDPNGWRDAAEGYFELSNCGDEAAEIWLDFSITIYLEGIVDTGIIIGDFPIWLGAGEVLSEEFIFPVPPFDAEYTFCVTATSGEATDSDCETMVVVGTEFPGFPFDGCGMVVQRPNCILFQPELDQEARFLLENYGDFEPGDMVFVSGLLQWDCETDCADVTGCVVDNAIEECGSSDPGFQFEACGVLLEGTDCVLFAPRGDEYMMLQIENSDNYGVGDTVYVAGLLMLECDLACSDAIACLVENSIEDCSDMPYEFPIDGCGLLVDVEGCLLIDMTASYHHDGGLFVMDDFGTFVAGDEVYVSGLATFQCETECPAAIGCITEYFIDSCYNNPPEWPIEGCGVLVQGTECVLFEMVDDSSGSFLLVLEDYGDFVVGDEVFVSGIYDHDCVTNCMEGDGCLTRNIIASCENEPPPEYPFEACGILVDSDNCVLFSMSRWGAPDCGWGELFELENLGTFGVGDTVFVSGMLDFECVPACADAMTCLVDNSIDVCTIDDSLPPPPPDSNYVEGCGSLVVGPEGCLLFVDEWLGFSVLLDNYSSFVEGDFVFVQGWLNTLCDVGECQSAFGCVTVDVIDSCGQEPPPQDTILVYLCGELVEVETGCVVFITGDSASLGMSGIFVLDNYGDYGPGNQVCLTGYLDFECRELCGGAFACIEVIDIASNGSMSSAQNFNASNYPNPFNPSTTISFEIQKTAQVSVVVYNLIGQAVRVLTDRVYSAGSHEVEWNSDDNKGNRVSSGVYFYRITAGDSSETKKMLMIK